MGVGSGGGGGVGLGVRVDGRRIEAFVKIQKKIYFFLGGGGVGSWGGASGWGVRGRCERRSKVFVKIQKKMRGGGWVGVGGSGSDQGFGRWG